MTFEVEVGGQARVVSIERAGRAEQYRVTVDGRSHDVHARRTGDFALLLVAETFPQKVPAISADKSQEDATLAASEGGAFRGKAPATYEVFTTPAGGAGELLVTLDGRTTVVTVNGRRRGRGSERAQHAPGEQPVIAPMPGRVVRVLVAPGDEVAARQGVVVVEAMKMENELRAPKGGRVKEVSVTPGTSVEAGRVLVVIE